MKPICHTIQTWLHEGHAAPAPLPLEALEDHARLCLQCQRELARALQMTVLLQDVAAEAAPTLSAQRMAARTIALSTHRRQQKRARLQRFLVPALSTAALCIAALSWQVKGVLTPNTPPLHRTAPLSTNQGTTPTTQRTRPEARVRMVWPSHDVFVISKTRKKQPPSKDRTIPTKG